MDTIEGLYKQIEETGDEVPLGVQKNGKFYSVEFYKGEWINLTEAELLVLLGIILKGIKRIKEE